MRSYPPQTTYGFFLPPKANLKIHPQINLLQSWVKSRWRSWRRSLGSCLRSTMPLLIVPLLLFGCGAGDETADLPVSPEELAKSISDKEIADYAKAVIAIEQLRQTTAQEMQQVSGDNSFANISCTQPKTISELTPQMRELAINFCTNVRTISEANSLIIPRFNAITINARNNPELKKRIDQELISLRK
ncbi:MAG: DUF4168 domain-containing protein [Coleofasciculaceae cyanobacterium SM2_1_6]|nr:DUF4168 domain-containing protein [Coleofasciculaceae cyanobacterium SM2_1_6]